MIRIEASQMRRTAEQSPRRSPAPVYWLIVRSGNGGIELLTIERDSEEILPVFSFEEEARMFVGLGDVGGEWQVCRSGAGELVSVLCGLWTSVEEVALDPLPQMVDDGAVDLVSLGRERFIEHIKSRMEHSISTGGTQAAARG